MPSRLTADGGQPDPRGGQSFYQAVKDHILANGSVGAEETTWLRRMLSRNGKPDDLERKFLHELRGEAKQLGPEFRALYEECVKQPPEQRTAS